MPKNQALLEGIIKFDLLEKMPNREQCLAALRELTKVQGPTPEAQAKALREAIDKHKPFWKAFLPDVMKDTGVADYFTSDDFLNSTSLENIMASASVQIIALGMEKLDKKELEQVAMLRPNMDKKALAILNKPFGDNLDAVPFWRDNLQPFKEQGDALGFIVMRALKRWLRNVISQHMTIEELINLKNSPNVLGLGYRLDQDELKLVNARIQQIASEQLQAFKKHIDILPKKNLGALNSDRALETEFKKVGTSRQLSQAATPDEFSEARAHLANRFLESKLSGFKNLDNALKEARDEGLKAQLKKQKINKYFIEHAKTNDWDFRQKLIIAWINKADLEISSAISELSTLEEFKQFLKDHKIAHADECSFPHMEAIQRVAHTKVFASKPELANRPALVKGFRQLAPKKQKELLGRKDFKLLLEADSSKALKKELGLDDAAAKKIVSEKNNLEQFKLIHNPVLAKVLSKMPIKLNALMIQNINLGLIKRNPPHFEAINIQNEREYVKMIGKVAKACGISVKTLNDAISPEDKAELIEQYEHNVDRTDPALALYGEASAAEEDLVSVLLNVSKKDPFSIDSASFEDYLKRSSDIKAFGDYCRLDEEGLDQLDNAVAHNAFANAKKGLLKKYVVSNEPSERAYAIDQMNQILKNFKSSRENLKKYSKDLGVVLTLEPASVLRELAPKFAAKDKDAQKTEEHYTKLAEECDEFIDKLERELKDLREYAAPNFLQRTADNLQEVDKSLRDINEQIMDTENLKNHLKEVREKLIKPEGILEAIKGAKEGSKGVYYKASSFADPYVGARESSKAPAGLKAGALLSYFAGSAGKLILKDKAKPGETINHDFGRKGGEFFYSQKTIDKEDKSLPSSLKTDNVAKDSSLYQIDSFPKDPAERMEFAMGMAADILLQLDGPPTKKNCKLVGAPPEAVAYLWKALLTYADVHPQNKFGRRAAFGPEDLNYSHSSFNPESLSPESLSKPPESKAAYDFQQEMIKMEAAFRDTQTVSALKQNFVIDMNTKLNPKDSFGRTATKRGSNAAGYLAEKMGAFKAVAQEERKKYGPAEPDTPADDASASPASRTRGT